MGGKGVGGFEFDLSFCCARIMVQLNETRIAPTINLRMFTSGESGLDRYYMKMRDICWKISLPYYVLNQALTGNKIGSLNDALGGAFIHTTMFSWYLYPSRH